MGDLYTKLKAYGESDYYPYHMPGHKRRLYGEMPASLAKMDITEIDGFDNLQHPEGILKALQEKAAKLCHAQESYLLVNGSTAGILSAVSAAVPFGGKLLMARNCHKSAYHSVYLRHLTVSYLYPEPVAGYPVYEAVFPGQVEEALAHCPDCSAVLIVSPTYEGRIADVEAISQIVHRRGKILIVDEAHGAHLGFAPGFAPGSNQCGADLVVQSVHKTLPAFTQTALLHRNGDRVDKALLERFLHIYQSSSPSYVLMAGIENALELVEKQGGQLFGSFLERDRQMRKALSACKRLRILSDKGGRQDVGKLVIDTSGAQIGGQELYERLLTDYHLQLEMASEQYCLAMFTLADTEEGYERLTQALLEIDGQLSADAGAEDAQCDRAKEAFPEAALSLAQAWDMPREWTPLEEAVGGIAAEFVNLYPPGVPILAPGERISENIKTTVVSYIKQGLTVQGIDRQGSQYGLFCICGRERKAPGAFTAFGK